MIDLKQWEQECGKVERGQTLRFDHTDCPAGQDTRRRLYLTRPASSAGVVLAFCHNCQNKGILSDEADKFRDFDAGILLNDKQVPFTEPENLTYDPNLWPTVATQWRIEKGLAVSQCLRAEIAYDANTHRVYLPIYNEVDIYGSPIVNTELLGFQLRRLEGTGPKYFNAYRDNEVKPYTRFNPEDKDMLFLVEDFASGMAVSDALMHQSVGVVVNYGVKVTPEVLHANSNMKRGIVWLDNDSDHIMEQAITIARTWQLISGVDCFAEDAMNRDPKEYTAKVIVDTWKDWSHRL